MAEVGSRSISGSPAYGFPVTVFDTLPKDVAGPRQAETTGLTRLLDETRAARWAGTRNEGSVVCQARTAIRHLTEHFGITEAAEVKPEHLRNLVRVWQASGLSQSTITRRLAALNVMGIKVQGCRPKGQRPLQWWLNPNDKEILLNWLRADEAAPHAHYRRELADHIEWTCYTGFRVEETMRLRWREVFMHWEDGQIDITRMSVTVPGLKTLGSHATLPLGFLAAKLFLRRWYEVAISTGRPPAPEGRVFPSKYWHLRVLWVECRKLIGAQDIRTCTLKSLRRSAARYLHVEQGMPLDVVRQYLRHSSVQTTMGYLRLVGGYNTEEMRRWV